MLFIVLQSEKICGQNDFQDYVNELKTSKAYNSLKSFLVREIQQHIKENYKGPLIGETMQVLIHKKIFISYKFNYFNNIICNMPLSYDINVK